MATFKVEAAYDEDAGVWYVCNSNLPGLATEAPTVDELVAKLKVMIPDLISAQAKQDGERIGKEAVTFEFIAHAEVSAAAA